ncbi:uncharacterized protein LOC134773085 [Penaeus indicus]|uniref:uncharacterized protein LOC134773085 n=1 Tax=Penaeus indicus TaxID=29960 RepID=UPI00300C9204
MAKQRARAKRDIPKVTVVKSEDGWILAEKEEVLRRWREYFEHLLNVENEWEELTELPAVEVNLQEVSVVLKKMKKNKSAGTLEVVVEMLDALGSEECGNHRGIKLLEHLLKIEEKILDQKIREVVDIGNMQFGFIPRRSTTDAVLILRQLQEKHLEGDKNLYHAFIDLEKVYDRVPREKYMMFNGVKVPMKYSEASSREVRVIQGTIAAESRGQ